MGGKLIIPLFLAVCISSCDNKPKEMKSQVINSTEKINSADCLLIMRITADAASSVMSIWRLNSSGIIPATESTILATEQNSNDYAAYLLSAFLNKNNYSPNDLQFCIEQYPDIMINIFDRNNRIKANQIFNMVITNSYQHELNNNALDFTIETYKAQ